MPSDLQVSNIRDLNNANSAISIASDGQVTISQNNPTVTLGANTTFPAGHTIQHKHINVESTNSVSRTHDITESWSIINIAVNFELTSFSATQGNTLLMSINGLNAYLTSDNTYATQIAISTDGASATEILVQKVFWFDSDGSNMNIPVNFSWAYTVPASFTNKTLSCITREQTSAPTSSPVWRVGVAPNDVPSGVNRRSVATFSVLEIQA